MGIQEFISSHGPARVVFRATEVIQKSGANFMDANAIVSEIASSHGITVAQIKSASRKRQFLRGRYEAYRAVRNLGWSYPRVGRYFGKRDHSTIIQGIRRLEEMEAQDA